MPRKRMMPDTKEGLSEYLVDIHRRQAKLTQELKDLNAEEERALEALARFSQRKREDKARASPV